MVETGLVIHKGAIVEFFIERVAITSLNCGPTLLKKTAFTFYLSSVVHASVSSLTGRWT